jgi:hypothetical protein
MTIIEAFFSGVKLRRRILKKIYEINLILAILENEKAKANFNVNVIWYNALHLQIQENQNIKREFEKILE